MNLCAFKYCCVHFESSGWNYWVLIFPSLTEGALITPFRYFQPMRPVFICMKKWTFRVTKKVTAEASNNVSDQAKTYVCFYFYNVCFLNFIKPHEYYLKMTLYRQRNSHSHKLLYLAVFCQISASKHSFPQKTYTVLMNWSKCHLQ